MMLGLLAISISMIMGGIVIKVWLYLDPYRKNMEDGNVPTSQARRTEGRHSERV